MSVPSRAGRAVTPRRALLHFWLIAIFAWSWLSVPHVTAGAADPSTIEQWTLTLLEAESKYSEQWSVLVQDLETGRQVAAFKPDLALIPASNRKIVTFALALEKFGPEYRFVTDLGLTHAERTAEGYIEANILLRSQGDPSLTLEFMDGQNPVVAIQGWVARMAELGYTKIRGDLLIDAAAFGAAQLEFPAAWEPKYRNHSYASLPTAVALNRNLIQVIAQPSSSVGAKGSIEIYPTQAGMTIVNETVTKSGKYQGLGATFDPLTGQLLVKGGLGQASKKQVVSLPHPDPLSYMVAILQEALAKNGVELEGRVRVITDPAESKTLRMQYLIARHESPPMPELLDQVMNDSDNFLAEQLWRATAFRATGSGNVDNARRVESEWYTLHNMFGVQAGFDGSGLSRQNTISAVHQVQILKEIYNSPYGVYLLETLPISGRRGTLRRRDLPYNRITAKTGTLSGVSALAGFVRDRSGQERYVFSVVGNAPSRTNGRLTKRINQLMKILVQQVDRSGNSRIKRYDPSIKELLETPS